MNNNAKEWVKALRSGEYEQGLETLRTSDGKFCCLGVACELAVKAGVIPAPLSHDPGCYGSNAYDFNRIALPATVREWLGLRDNSGHFVDAKGYESFLSNLNDRGTSFEEIADIIESEPEGMFYEEKTTDNNIGA